MDLAERVGVIPDSHWLTRSTSRLNRSRGFTLLELVAVVAIIAIFAALAIPATVAQVRNRKLHQAARELSIVYRQAKMKAMGRGSAVLVRFQNNAFTVLEAVRDNAVGSCENVPYSRCQDNTWSDPDETRPVTTYSPDPTDILLTLEDSAGAAVATLDVCFSPIGRTFSRTVITDAQAFAPLQQAYVAELARPSGPSLPRKVVFMPSGSARLMALGTP